MSKRDIRDNYTAEWTGLRMNRSLIANWSEPRKHTANYISSLIKVGCLAEIDVHGLNCAWRMGVWSISGWV